ncbi:hypothetical protein [Pseudomonas indica]|nr:hypothetical protein [Pseudomonas indica]
MGAGAAAALLPVIADALAKSGLGESDQKALATLIATGVGTSVGSGSGGKVVAGGTAAGVELYNRQLHRTERKTLEEEADRLSEKGRSQSGATWEDLLLLASGAELDAAENARLQAILAQFGPDNPEADVFARDLKVALGVVQGLAERNIVLTWSDGKPIVANGAPVYAFRATNAQYNDSTLFNTSAPYLTPQGSPWAGTEELVPELWKQQFGERNAVRYLNEILYSSTSQSDFDDAFQRVSQVASGGVANVTWDVDAALLLSGSGGAVQAVRTMLARRTIAAEAGAAGERIVQEELSNLVANGSSYFTGSRIIQKDTTVQLTEEVVLTSGQVVPKGSVVTVNGDAMKIVQPDGNVMTGSYSRAVAEVKGLPAPEMAEASRFIAASEMPFKVGQVITNAGRAVTKHPEYFGFSSTQELRKIFRSDAELNELASNAVQEILSSGSRTTGAGGRYPNGWVTYTLPDGRAASWTASGEFIGFRGVQR